MFSLLNLMIYIQHQVFDFLKYLSFLIINKLLQIMNADSALFHVFLNYGHLVPAFSQCILSHTCGRQLGNLHFLILIKARRLTSALPQRVREMFSSFVLHAFCLFSGLYF